MDRFVGVFGVAGVGIGEGAGVGGVGIAPEPGAGDGVFGGVFFVAAHEIHFGGGVGGEGLGAVGVGEELCEGGGLGLDVVSDAAFDFGQLCRVDDGHGVGEGEIFVEGNGREDGGLGDGWAVTFAGGGGGGAGLGHDFGEEFFLGEGARGGLGCGLSRGWSLWLF